ncbi:hypothetical protein SADUNF_Sadunf07G0094000 [Salix dunnii]|uniref:Uncharacterized protein n=1 Tax=Salix dunnii TaxID=1413687 RepID=A0A835MW34_9ROSI|nr:hypothetical protein SADUNF_Sadunf07G0094000 [Salix dunnii]
MIPSCVKLHPTGLNRPTKSGHTGIISSSILGRTRATGFPVEVIQWKKSLAVNGRKLNCSKNELKFLIGHVVGEANSCPSRLHSTITLQFKHNFVNLRNIAFAKIVATLVVAEWTLVKYLKARDLGSSTWSRL